PAGSIDAARAAINAGADAIYLGGKNFSARNLAANFDDDELAQVLDFAHLRGVRVYIAANTLYSDGEISDVLDFLARAYSLGADAFIMQDLGVMALAKKRFPDIEYHASTQMAVHDLGGVSYLAKAGFDRVILARELGIEQIEHIAAASPIGVEVFVHGALCAGYSGMCLMSSLIGGRSGNRGDCAQSCRRIYTLERAREGLAQGYLLSPKDLVGADYVWRLIDAGVAALKIEGRMKSPEYVFAATDTYKRIMDDRDFNPAENIAKTAQIFSRGQSGGYFESHGGRHMINAESSKPLGTHIGRVVSYDSRRGYGKFFTDAALIPGDGIEIVGKNAGCYISKSYEPGEIAEFFIKAAIAPGDKVCRSFDKKLDDEIKWLMQRDIRKTPVQARLYAHSGEPLRLEIAGQAVSGGIVDIAKNQPMDAARIIEQLSKTGDTPFVFDFTKIDIGDNIFIRIKDLNDLRRDAIAILEKSILDATRRNNGNPGKYTAPVKKTHPPQPLRLSVQTRNLQQFRGAIQGGCQRIYYEANGSLVANIERIAADCAAHDIELFAALPPIIDSSLTELIHMLEQSEILGYLISNYGHLAALENSAKIIIPDYGLNIRNSATAEGFGGLITPSAEMNLAEISKMGRVEIIAHGRIAAMHTRQCPTGNFVGDKTGKNCAAKGAEGYSLKDERGAKFPIISNCSQCIATILNSKPIFMLDKLVQLPANTEFIRIILSDEDMADAHNLAAAYTAALAEGHAPQTPEIRAAIEKSGHTYGYYFTKSGERRH
ncbi:MAG: U32 family peptidase, partial [Defluviitaleaceae bacterium]|nr:U32 family peptidase [Defluviitaleaceae bacterium]